MADRECVEISVDSIFDQASSHNVAFLVVGDPFGATTHSDLMIRAIRKGIQTKVIHNASVMNSIAECGLQLYCFGPTISIPFFTERWRPESFYFKLKTNLDNGCHTLCLLDIKVKEQSEENMIKNVKIYEPPRYMTVNQALAQLCEIESNHKQLVVQPDRIVVGIARLGSETQIIAAGRVQCIEKYDFGAPLQCFLVPGKMHECEFELLSMKYCVDDETAFREAYAKNHR